MARHHPGPLLPAEFLQEHVHETVPYGLRRKRRNRDKLITRAACFVCGFVLAWMVLKTLAEYGA